MALSTPTRLTQKCQCRSLSGVGFASPERRILNNVRGAAFYEKAYKALGLPHREAGVFHSPDVSSGHEKSVRWVDGSRVPFASRSSR